MNKKRKSLPIRGQEAVKEIFLTPDFSIAADELIELLQEGIPVAPVDLYWQNFRLRQVLLEVFPGLEAEIREAC